MLFCDECTKKMKQFQSVSLFSFAEKTQPEKKKITMLIWIVLFKWHANVIIFPETKEIMQNIF